VKTATPERRFNARTLPGQILRVFKRKAGAARVSVGDLGGAQTTAIDSTCGYLPTDKFEYFPAASRICKKAA